MCAEYVYLMDKSACSMLYEANRLAIIQLEQSLENRDYHTHPIKTVSKFSNKLKPCSFVSYALLFLYGGRHHMTSNIIE